MSAERHARTHARRAVRYTATARTLVAVAVLGLSCVLSVGTAAAAVHAFSALTGTEEPSFVHLDSTGAHVAFIPDDNDGVFVLGHLTVAGHARSIVHVLADGSVDPAFHAAVGYDVVFAGVVRGDDLVLVGNFTQIDGGRRRRIAVLDARSGRLRAWVPTMPSGGSGQLAVLRGLLITSVGNTMYAWRGHERRPEWVRPNVGVLMFAWRGNLVVAREQSAYTYNVARSALRSLHLQLNFTDLLNEGGRLYESSKGSYLGYGPQEICGENSPDPSRVVWSGEALTGTATQTFVAWGPADVDPPAPDQRIFSCTSNGDEAPGFMPPSLPATHLVVGMAVVGTHLLVFTWYFDEAVIYFATPASARESDTRCVGYLWGRGRPRPGRCLSSTRKRVGSSRAISSVSTRSIFRALKPVVGPHALDSRRCAQPSCHLTRDTLQSNASCYGTSPRNVKFEVIRLTHGGWFASVTSVVPACT